MKPALIILCQHGLEERMRNGERNALVLLWFDGHDRHIEVEDRSAAGMQYLVSLFVLVFSFMIFSFLIFGSLPNVLSQ